MKITLFWNVAFNGCSMGEKSKTNLVNKVNLILYMYILKIYEECGSRKMLSNFRSRQMWPEPYNPLHHGHLGGWRQGTQAQRGSTAFTLIGETETYRGRERHDNMQEKRRGLCLDEAPTAMREFLDSWWSSREKPEWIEKKEDKHTVYGQTQLGSL